MNTRGCTEYAGDGNTYHNVNGKRTHKWNPETQRMEEINGVKNKPKTRGFNCMSNEVGINFNYNNNNNYVIDEEETGGGFDISG